MTIPTTIGGKVTREVALDALRKLFAFAQKQNRMLADIGKYRFSPKWKSPMTNAYEVLLNSDRISDDMDDDADTSVCDDSPLFTQRKE